MLFESNLLDIRVTPNPVPLVYSGGDCGACCISSISGKSVQEVYELQDGVEAIHRNALFDKILPKLGMEWNDDLPEDNKYMDGSYGKKLLSFGWPAFMNWKNWFERHRRFIDMGWIGMATVAYKKDGHVTGETDHWVLLNGYEIHKEEYEIDDYPGMKYERNVSFVNVVCSAAGGSTWKTKASDFLKYSGGYTAIYINYKDHG